MSPDTQYRLVVQAFDTITGTLSPESNVVIVNVPGKAAGLKHGQEDASWQVFGLNCLYRKS